MKIGILGAGIIGQTIGRKWAAAGHDLMFGVRNIKNPKLEELQKEFAAFPNTTTVGSTMDAIAFGEVILIAIPGTAVAGMAQAFGKGLDGKILIDATNKVGGQTLNSVTDLLEHAPQAHVFRAFHTLGWENFANPAMNEQTIDLFYAGPDDNSRQVVEQLVADVGLNPIYVGGHEQLDTVDGLTKLWFAMAFGQGKGRRLAFKMMTD